jgi:hypothetical protein
MTHFSTLRTKWTDTEVIVLALIHLDLLVKIDTDIRGASGQRVRCNIACILNGDYDLGYIKNSDGQFDLVVDLYGIAKKYNQTILINYINFACSLFWNLKLNGDLNKYLSNCGFYELIDRLKNEYRKDEISNYTKSIQSNKSFTEIKISNPTGVFHMLKFPKRK